jgi:hypothetical protein
VRDLETFMVEGNVVVKKDIEINIAGAFINDLLAAQGLFDVLEGV